MDPHGKTVCYCCCSNEKCQGGKAVSARSFFWRKADPSLPGSVKKVQIGLEEHLVQEDKFVLARTKEIDKGGKS